MRARDVRAKFLDFFRAKEHAVIPSASLIPENDPSVLFTTAGMHPLVPYLLGETHPMGRRLANAQKCVRTGDIDSVGDNRHLTFFEMLGNWSLGDYYKQEAIAWSFEFLTAKEWLGLDPRRLYISVFAGDADAPRDEESIKIWQEEFRKAGIEARVADPKNNPPLTLGPLPASGARQGEGENAARIFLYGKENNWWGPPGKTGPCGPNTEMYYDTELPHDPGFGEACHPACDCGRFVEIWNDVFMTYQKLEVGSRRSEGAEELRYEYVPLAQKNVDTGLGFERVAAILEGERTPFETTLFLPIVYAIEEAAGKSYLANAETTRAMRIIADHLRAATFILGDPFGVVPSNVDQGYIVRRLIRRAVREAYSLGLKSLFTAKIAEVVVKEYGEIYPELVQNRTRIITELTEEEKRFAETIGKGLARIEVMIREMHRLTQILSRFSQGTIDDTDDREFLAQVLKAPWITHADELKAVLDARDPAQVKDHVSHFLSVFAVSGKFLFDLYTTYGFPVELALEVLKEASADSVIPSEVPARGGCAFGAEGSPRLPIRYDKETFDEKFAAHQALSRAGVTQKFAGGLADHSQETVWGHTATHLLHQSLRTVLGNHVGQKGSNITPDRLRFDFSHPEKMTPEQLKAVEDLVNEQIKKDLPVHFEILEAEEAKRKGAIGLFEDTYAQLGNKIKVYFVGDETRGYFSREICGGPHVEHTGEIGAFKILKEEAVAKGIRRIKAVVGEKAIKAVRK